MFHWFGKLQNECCTTFVDRGLHFEFAGIIYQHSEAFDIMYLRPAGLIREDGTIGDSL
jgi:hypothetical protein